MEKKLAKLSKPFRSLSMKGSSKKQPTSKTSKDEQSTVETTESKIYESTESKSATSVKAKSKRMVSRREEIMINSALRDRRPVCFMGKMLRCPIEPDPRFAVHDPTNHNGRCSETKKSRRKTSGEEKNPPTPVDRPLDKTWEYEYYFKMADPGQPGQPGQTSRPRGSSDVADKPDATIACQTNPPTVSRSVNTGKGPDARRNERLIECGLDGVLTRLDKISCNLNVALRHFCEVSQAQKGAARKKAFKELQAGMAGPCSTGYRGAAVKRPMWGGPGCENMMKSQVGLREMKGENCDFKRALIYMNPAVECPETLAEIRYVFC